MQLDRTRVAIRERSLGDVLDLAFRLMRSTMGPILVLALPTAIPLLLFNYVCLAKFIPWNTEMYEPVELAERYTRYLAALFALVAVQAPLMTLCMPGYLGRYVFEDNPDVRTSIRESFALWSRLVWCFGVCRLVFPVMFLACFVRVDYVSAAEVWMWILGAFSLLFRAMRPYLPEIILLERNPLRARGKNVITVGRRNASLHNPNGADLVGRWMLAATVGALLLFSLFGTLLGAQSLFLEDGTLSPLMMLVGAPLSLFLLTVYMTVFRFLSYLDLRIRQEGWEVELLLRAEAGRMKRGLAA